MKDRDHGPASPDARGDRPNDAPDARPARRVPIVVVVVVAALALVAGVVATLVIAGDDGARLDAVRPDAPPRDVAAGPEALADAGFAPLPEPPATVPDAPAADARGAVAGFLAAEVNDEFERSFEFLADEDRDAYGSAAGWVAAHADVMPPVTGFDVGEPDGDDQTSRVASRVGFDPGLDEVVGLTPARAEVEWVVRRGAEGWGVSLQESDFAPIYAPDDAATRAVRDWVTARQSCERTGEWGGTLLGRAALAAQLCDAQGAAEVDSPDPLDQLDAQPFTAAFGPDAVTWARVVPVAGPVELRAVVAPIGPTWRVIGVLPPRPEGTP